MKTKIESLTEKVKDQTMQSLLLKREKDELTVIKSSLEGRLSEALLQVG